MAGPSTTRPAVAAAAVTAALLIFWPTAALWARGFDLAGTVDGITYAALLLGMSVLGVLIGRHDTRNPVGWLFCLTPLGVAASIGFGSYYRLAGSDAPLSAAANWVSSWAWAAGLAGFALFLPLLFPDGRPPGRRWRVLAVADLAGLALLVTAIGAGPHTRPIAFGVAAVLAVLILVGLASAVVRYRRAVGIEKLQMREVVWAVALSLTLFVAISVTGSSEILYNIAYALIPLAVGLAMLRYRLYDVDVVIRRTVTYTCLALALAAVYLAAITTTGALLRSLAHESGNLAVSLSTLAVAVMFQPLRTRIGRLIDHRFNRGGYDLQATVESFAARLRGQTELEATTDELRRVVATTIQPRQISVWLRASD